MKGNIYPRSHRLQSLVHLLIVLMLDCVGARCTSFKCHFIIELYKKKNNKIINYYNYTCVYNDARYGK